MRHWTMMGIVGAGALAIGLAAEAGRAAAEGHGIAMYGEPALPADFEHLPYANPDAPKGGRIVTGEAGAFDSLNPFVLEGNPPWALQYLTVESLLGRSWDEPFTLYARLAERVETAPDRSWVEFTLNPAARFSDGSPVTVEDVIWSFETLGTEGHPRYRGFQEKIASIEPTGERGVRIEFVMPEGGEPDREAPLIAALRPILQKSQWEGREFGEDPLEPAVTSAPYVVDDFEPGRFVSLRRDPDYWGADLPLMQGQANFDEVRFEFFGDDVVVLEALKAGEIDVHREFNAGKWNTQYDFPAVRSGEIVLEEVAHQRPSGITGLVMNTRRAPFDDVRVRDALIHAFNFEFVNETLNDGAIPRITSYFSNSPLAMEPGTPAEGREREILEPFAASLPPGALEGYALPVSDGTARNRGNVAAALDILREAGWTAQDGTLRDEAGEPLEFEILLQSGATETHQVVDMYVEALRRIGVAPRVTVVDAAQYEERIQDFDFDMTWTRRGVSLSPGNEQRLYWGSAAADEPGSRNVAGIRDPAVDAAIEAILTSGEREDFEAAVRALDRALTAGRYVIPVWEWNISRLAYKDELEHPERIPIYGDWIGWLPDVWWHAEAGATEG